MAGPSLLKSRRCSPARGDDLRGNSQGKNTWSYHILPYLTPNGGSVLSFFLFKNLCWQSLICFRVLLVELSSMKWPLDQFGMSDLWCKGFFTWEPLQSVLDIIRMLIAVRQMLALIHTLSVPAQDFRDVLLLLSACGSPETPDIQRNRLRIGASQFVCSLNDHNRSTGRVIVSLRDRLQVIPT